MYDKLFTFLNKYFKKATLFRVLFNISPMYKRSCGKIIFASEDLHVVKIKIPLSYKNRNYVGSIFGGSLFAATDPIYMIQLMQILGKDFVVWDKKTDIKFKRPAYKDAFASFEFTAEEIENILQKVDSENELDYTKILHITDKNGTIFAELDKTLYIATKTFYKQKRSLKK